VATDYGRNYELTRIILKKSIKDKGLKEKCDVDCIVDISPARGRYEEGWDGRAAAVRKKLRYFCKGSFAGKKVGKDFKKEEPLTEGSDQEIPLFRKSTFSTTKDPARGC